jgi:rhodanese-related sulfurtransferase
MDIISIEELHHRMNAGEQINLIDVREPYEHEEFNIGGLLHPLGRIMSADVDDLEGMKDREVIVYCRSGNRSGQAAMMLEAMGFRDVKNLQGGMLAWRQQFPG